MPRTLARPTLNSAFAVVLLLAGCGGNLRATDQTDQAAIRELIDRTEAMNNAGDVEGWVALFESGAVYMPPGQPAVTTLEGLREAGRAGFTNWRSNIDIVPEEVVTSGDLAFARSRVTGTATPVAGGAPITIDVKQLVIYRRQADGGWRIARLMTNANG